MIKPILSQLYSGYKHTVPARPANVSGFIISIVFEISAIFTYSVIILQIEYFSVIHLGILRAQNCR